MNSEMFRQRGLWLVLVFSKPFDNLSIEHLQTLLWDLSCCISLYTISLDKV